MIDRAVDLGFEGYFVDEPTPLRDCFCSACQARYEEWFGGDLLAADATQQERFRERCVVDYVRTIADYCAATHPALETMCCIMPIDEAMWAATSRIESLTNLGTDMYWVNDDRDVADMVPILRGLDAMCKQHGKIHHEWLQCWHVKSGREERILEQGRVLIQEQPDALYVWAWEGQVGITETCEDPTAAWAKACDVLRLAKDGQG